jgi:hypothetical protein
MHPRSRPPSTPPTLGGHQIPMTISATVFSKTAPAKPPTAGGAGHRGESRPCPETAHRRQRRSSHRRNRLQVPHRTELNPLEPEPGWNAEDYVRTGDSARTDCGQYTTYTARIFGDLISYPNDRKGSTAIAGKGRERVTEHSISYIDIHAAETLFPARVSVWAAYYTDHGEADRTPLPSRLRRPGVRQWRRGRSRTFAAIAPAATSGAGRTAW